MKTEKSTIGWLVTGIVIGALAMNLGGTALAQQRSTVPPARPTTKYLAVDAQRALNEPSGELLTALLNQMSGQGYEYVGSAVTTVIFKK